MPNRDIVAIGTSAGGVEALLFLAGKFGPSFPAAILVTLHLPSHYRSSLDDILSRAGRLKASFAVDGEPLKYSHIYLAPPGQHLLVEDDKLVLGIGPRENNARPAIDPMLRSVAVCCGGRAIGVILTGTLSDGASGLWAVKRCGGLTVVQDPKDATFPEMPMTALERTTPDHIAALGQMPILLDALVHQPARPGGAVPERIRMEVAIAKSGMSHMSEMGPGRAPLRSLLPRLWRRHVGNRRG